MRMRMGMRMGRGWEEDGKRMGKDRGYLWISESESERIQIIGVFVRPIPRIGHFFDQSIVERSITDPGAIGRPPNSATTGKNFFFIEPIGNSVINNCFLRRGCYSFWKGFCVWLVIDTVT